jgi:putative zinc finger/helix-turn-helix YgiT family protein
MEYLPRRCPNCREKRVREIVERYETRIEHDGGPYEVAVPDLLLLKCEACGNRILPPASEDRVSDALRTAAGLLTPSEIATRRAALNLSAGEMAVLLHIPEAVYSRWESGGAIQQRHSDLLMRSLFAVPELRAYLGTRTSQHTQVA